MLSEPPDLRALRIHADPSSRATPEFRLPGRVAAPEATPPRVPQAWGVDSGIRSQSSNRTPPGSRR